jgi:ANTAR domain
MGAREYGDELLHRLLRLVMDSIPGALGAGVGLPGRSVAGTGVAGPLDAAQWAAVSGPLQDAVVTGGPIVLPAPPEAGASEAGASDVAAPLDWSRWPELLVTLASSSAQTPGPSATDQQPPGVPPGVRGVVAIPGEWGGEAPVVFSVYLAAVPDAAVLEQIDRLEPLLAEALSVVEYWAGEELRSQQMLQMVQYRRVIEQAKGMVMAALGQDAGTAFATLARASQHFNVRLRNLSVALVEHVGTAPAEGPDDPAQVVRPTDSDRRVAAQVWAALTADGDRPIPAR